VDPSGEKEEESTWDKFVNGTQLVLDVVGLIPIIGEPADGANALIYEVRGDHLNAALSGASMIPIAGWLGTGGKFVNKAIKYSDEAASLAKSGTKAIKSINSVPQKALDTLKYIEKNGVPPSNYKGGKIFKNTEGNLPKGNYKEYDIDAKVKGVDRGPERMTINQDTGEVWYSPDHYESFIKIK